MPRYVETVPEFIVILLLLHYTTCDISQPVFHLQYVMQNIKRGTLQKLHASHFISKILVNANPCPLFIVLIPYY